MNCRTQTTAILAMTADGKIADKEGSAARFGSANDKRHLERQVSWADGVIFGAKTLRAYGTTLSVSDPDLIAARIERSQSPQPVQIVASASAVFDPNCRFFQQPVPRWLLTVPNGSKLWRDNHKFDRVVSIEANDNDYLSFDWKSALARLRQLGLNKLAILGGGELVASLMAVDAIDELWLTVCPTIFGGKTAPTPVGGVGWLQDRAIKLNLLSVRQIEAEVFLHYRVARNLESGSAR